MFNLPCSQEAGRDVLKVCMRTMESRASVMSGMFVLLPYSGACLLPPKHARECNQEIQSIQTSYALVGETSSPFKPFELLFGSICHLLP